MKNKENDKNKEIMPFIIALDNDKAGKDATKQLIKEFDKHNIKYIIAKDLFVDFTAYYNW